MCATESGQPTRATSRGRPKGARDIKPRKRRKPKDKPGRVKDLLHKRFGHLVVISRGPTNQGKPRASVPALWYAQCDCGNIKLTNARSLCRGELKTCAEKGCPFKAALHTAAFHKSKDSQILKQAIDKVGKVGFQLTADEVRMLLKAPCKLCGQNRPGNEIRCYDQRKGYVLHNSYPICSQCSGIVPISHTYHLTWPQVLANIQQVVQHLALAGEMEPGIAKIFHEAKAKVEEKIVNKCTKDIPIEHLCY